MSGHFNFLQSHHDFFLKNGEKIIVKKGRYISNYFDESKWVYFLESGIVRVSFGTHSGDDRLIGYFLAGMTFARNGSFFELENDGLEYCAHTQAVLYRLPNEVFIKQLQKDPEFNADYTSSVLKNQIYLIARIVYQGEPNAERRFYEWLKFMIRFYGKHTDGGVVIEPQVTQYDIANFLHITRVSTNKIVRKYIAKGYISVANKTITVHDTLLKLP